MQFIDAFRKLFFSSFLQNSTGNCDQNLDTLLVQFSREKSNMPILVKPSNQPNTLDIGPTDYHNNDVNWSIIEANPICYVAGYLLKKCLNKHNCKIFKGSLVANQFDDNRKLFCLFKAYDTEKSEFGGLHAPPIYFLDYVTQMEDVFIASFSVFCKSSSVAKHILAKLNDVSTKSVLACDDFPLDYLRKVFLRMRIYYCLKFPNRDFASCKLKNRKYIKVSYL